jgi:hypothetical protein
MIPDLADLAALRSEQEKDEAFAVAWIKEMSSADLLKVWFYIQRLGGSNERELISRFAQLGMSHAMLLAGSDERPR